MSPLHSFILFAGILFPCIFAFVDFGPLTLPVEPLYHPTPRPNQLPENYDLRYEILPSMITAVAPSVTIAANGTHQTVYSLHYHHYFSKSRQGKGIFDKRGVFASDPPIATCTQCGGGNTTYTPPTLTTSTLSCTTHTYHGVFDFPPSTTTSSCYDSNYTGVFQPSTSSSTGLPCCFTIPASCQLNSTSFANATTSSFMASTGVFRSTTTSTTSMLSTTSTTSRFSLTTPSSTSGRSSQSQSGTSSQSQGAILNSASTSASTRTTVTVISGTTTTVTMATSSASTRTTTTSGSSSSVISSQPYTSPSSSITTVTTSYSIIVISSTTITITNAGTSTSTTGSGTSSSLSTLTVITGTGPTTASISVPVSVITSIVSNTIVGCGEASGSGVVEGSGTVYLAGTPIVASGTASGVATSVVGCGTIIATTGTFTGTASITGCGSGSGIGTLTGTGTIWPRYGGGLISFVTSGIIAGQGNFSGCGTLTGSGTFVATAGSPVLITLSTTPSRPTKTISVYLSYCPDAMATTNSMFRLASGSNLTAQPVTNSITSFSPSNFTLPTTNSTSILNPLCQTCPNSVGVCCPPTVSCSSSDGKCPLYALENSGNMINGYLIQQVVNSSAPVAGRKKVRALARKEIPELGIGKDLAKLELEVERELNRRREKKKAHHKHF